MSLNKSEKSPEKEDFVETASLAKESSG